MADLRLLVALAKAEQDRYARLAESTGVLAGNLWDRFRPVSDADLAAWQNTIVPIVTGSQQAAATQRIGFVTAYSNLAGVPVAAPSIDVAALVSGLRDGTDPVTVYARPTITTRKALSDGRPYLDALSAGRARAVQTAETDVMLAARLAEQEAMSAYPHIVGYRRVPNANCCELCALAATRRYHVRDLRPCHGNCRCSVAPIVGTDDPGEVIDREANRRLKQLGAGQEETYRRQIQSATKAGNPDRVAKIRADREAFRSTRNVPPGTQYGELVTVHEHGELGPTLSHARDHFTGPADI